MRDGSIRLPFETDLLKESNTSILEDDSAQTIVASAFKPVHDEFLSFVRSQDSISQLSFNVNDSASNKTFAEVYEMGKVLGEGGFAFVYQCRHLGNNHQYAVKEVIKKDGSNGDEIRDEINALRMVKESPHFVRLLDVFEEVSTTYLIMEEMKGGDLLDKLAEIEVYEEWEARKVARTLLEAVHYCHKRKIAHRDIKPENILLPRADDITLIKLADFGCARRWNKPNEMHTLCGSPQYVAPEVVGDTRAEGEGYNSQCDLWSVGVVLYIILGGYAPFESEDENELLDLICSANYEFHEEYWDDIDEPPRQLIAELLQPDPKVRSTGRQALRSPWLRRRDGDWVKEMDESTGSTFSQWLEKRNSSNHSSSSRLGMSYSGHDSAPNLEPMPDDEDNDLIQNHSNSSPKHNATTGWDHNDSNHTLGTWELGYSNHGELHHDKCESRTKFEDDGPPALIPGPMHDSSTANLFTIADSCAE